MHTLYVHCVAVQLNAGLSGTFCSNRAWSASLSLGDKAPVAHGLIWCGQQAALYVFSHLPWVALPLCSISSILSFWLLRQLPVHLVLACMHTLYVHCVAVQLNAGFHLGLSAAIQLRVLPSRLGVSSSGGFWDSLEQEQQQQSCFLLLSCDCLCIAPACLHLMVAVLCLCTCLCWGWGFLFLLLLLTHAGCLLLLLRLPSLWWGHCGGVVCTAAVP
jgi:hypothetical protein